MNLLKSIDSYLVDRDLRETMKKERTSHHPSAVNKCMRQQYYSWIKQPITNPRSATSVYRMSIGKWIEKGIVEDVLKPMFGEDKIKTQVEIFHHSPELKYPIHGYMDVVIEMEDESGNVVFTPVEIKTSFGRGIKNIQLSGKPREDDATQSKVYISTRKDFKQIALIYLGRDSFYRTEFDLSMEGFERDEFIAEIVKRFKVLEEHIENKTLPEREYEAIVFNGEIVDRKQVNKVVYTTDWQCKPEYCLWSSECYKHEIEDMGLHLPTKTKEGEDNE